jgi:hypothetical protein
VVGEEERSDLALLSVHMEPDVAPAARMGDAFRLREGDSVRLYGFDNPPASGLTVLPASVANFRGPFFTVNETIRAGWSGGPVMRGGRVVGVMSNHTYNPAFVVGVEGGDRCFLPTGGVVTPINYAASLLVRTAAAISQPHVGSRQQFMIAACAALVAAMVSWVAYLLALTAGWAGPSETQNLTRTAPQSTVAPGALTSPDASSGPGRMPPVPVPVDVPSDTYGPIRDVARGTRVRHPADEGTLTQLPASPASPSTVRITITCGGLVPGSSSYVVRGTCHDDQNPPAACGPDAKVKVLLLRDGRMCGELQTADGNTLDPTWVASGLLSNCGTAVDSLRATLLRRGLPSAVVAAMDGSDLVDCP